MSNAPAITEKRFVQSSPLRVSTRFFPLLRWIWTRYPSNLISWSHWSPDGALAFSVANCGLMNPGIPAEADVATTLRARLIITLLKTPAYRGILKEARGLVIDQVIRRRRNIRREG